MLVTEIPSRAGSGIVVSPWEKLLYQPAVLRYALHRIPRPQAHAHHPDGHEPDQCSELCSKDR